MIIYADTSALAKLILQEDGSLHMREAIANAEVILCATIGYVELKSAFAAAVRSRRLGADEAHETRSALESLWQSISEVELLPAVIRRAGDFSERLSLRAYDAVHLSALAEAGRPGDVSLACWDAQLRRAANDFGYQLIPALGRRRSD